jgi:hypothetical protein
MCHNLNRRNGERSTLGASSKTDRLSGRETESLRHIVRQVRQRDGSIIGFSGLRPCHQLPPDGMPRHNGASPTQAPSGTLLPITPSYRKDGRIEASGREERLILVRVGNLCGILQCVNALLMVCEVPHGRGFDIHTVRPCLSARGKNLLL